MNDPLLQEERAQFNEIITCLIAAALVTYMELSVGGFGWIPNLLVPDESLILPVALGLINLAIVEVSANYHVITSTVRTQSTLFNVL